MRDAAPRGGGACDAFVHGTRLAALRPRLPDDLALQAEANRHARSGSRRG